MGDLLSLADSDIRIEQIQQFNIQLIELQSRIQRSFQSELNRMLFKENCPGIFELEATVSFYFGRDDENAITLNVSVSFVDLFSTSYSYQYGAENESKVFCACWLFYKLNEQLYESKNSLSDIKNIWIDIVTTDQTVFDPDWR